MEKGGFTAVLADGQGEDRKALRRILEEGGYPVLGEAQDGVELIRICEELRPTAVFLELSLPFLDGLSAAAYLRAQGLADLIFFVSAENDSGACSAALDLGAVGFLQKPAAARRLLPAVAAALARDEAVRRLRMECGEMERRIEEHRTLERAKCAVMEREGLSAGEAQDFLCRLAQAKQLPLLKVAGYFTAMACPRAE